MVKSTRENVSAYGRGRQRRWRWSARVWHAGADASTQLRRQGFASEQAARDDMGRVLTATREGKATTVAGTDVTLADALTRLLAEKVRAKSVGEYTRIAEHLKRAFGAATPLTAITGDRISHWRTEQLGRVSRQTGELVSPPSINRPLALLRHLLKRAATEWNILPSAPVVRLERERQGRLRWATPEEATRLLAACAQSGNTDLLHVVTVALYTGARQSEILRLTWDRVDRTRGVIQLEVTKSGKRREVPYPSQVEAVFARRPRAGETVFRARRWDSYRSAWERALRVARVEDFKFHDLRHTYASWLVQRGRPLVEVKDLLGHATLTMTLRYAHLAPEHLREAVNVFEPEPQDVAVPV